MRSSLSFDNLESGVEQGVPLRGSMRLSLSFDNLGFLGTRARRKVWTQEQEGKVWTEEFARQRGLYDTGL